MQPIFENLEIARSHKLPNLDYMVSVESALYPVPSLCQTQRRGYGLAHYHGAAEFKISEAVANFF